MSKWIIICCFVFGYSLKNIAFADSFEEAKQILAQCIEGRKKINSGQMILQSKYEGRGSGTTYASSYTMDITFDRERFFIKKTEKKRTNFYCSNCDISNSFVCLDLQPIMHVDPNIPKKEETDQQVDHVSKAVMYIQENHIVMNPADTAGWLKKRLSTRDYSIPDFQQIGIIPCKSFMTWLNPLENFTIGFTIDKTKVVNSKSGNITVNPITVHPIVDESIDGDICKK
ncbi:MAG: hypothetical protein LBJ67_14660, partial [Planctomycetaceae bacterium]|nr:hypothetical protein [Planctomycetaceae bacterium]